MSKRRRKSPNSQHGGEVYKRLLRDYAKPFWVMFVIAVFANIAFSLVDAVIVRSIKPLLDVGLIEKDLDFLAKIPFYLVGLALVRTVFDFLASYCMSWAGFSVVKKLRNDVFAHIMKMPGHFFDTTTSGQLLSKVTYNTDRVMKASTDALTTVVKEGAFIIFALVSMFLESWRLSLLFATAVPFIALVVWYTTRRFRVISRRIQDSMGNITHAAEEAIGGYRVVKTYDGYDYEVARFEKAVQHNRRQSLKLAATKAMASPITQLIVVCALAFVVYQAGLLIVSGEVTAGGFVAILAFMLLTRRPLKKLTRINSVIQQGIAAAESLFDIMDMPTESQSGKPVQLPVSGHIQFKQLYFSYPESSIPALSNINVDIQPGESVALVGRSGSGKSTMVNLLLRMYEATDGCIELDGQDIAELRLSDLRLNCSIVSQHVTLFNDTIRNNIAYGRLNDVDDEQIIQAAKAAHAWDFISQLPEGLDTLVGDNGLLLSGGQRQRLAIARAILKNAPVLIFDEATSALDTESEQYVQQSIAQLMQGRTSIIIAHRLSTIQKVDRILVMDKGQIIEQGNHEHLLAQKGHYWRLYQMQFHGEHQLDVEHAAVD